MALSIIIPVLNEATNIVATLSPLQPMRSRGVEVIVVDGGSSDNTLALAAPHCDAVIASDKGRATQMNAGAAVATHSTLLFLHADSLLPEDADFLIAAALASDAGWGHFTVGIAGTHVMLPVIAWFMNHRSRLSGVATGDQGIFMSRTRFTQVDGFPAQPLMEDVEITSRLRKISAPVLINHNIITSGRRWEKYGVWRTILTMWHIRLAYFFGTPPVKLHRQYYGR